MKKIIIMMLLVLLPLASAELITDGATNVVTDITDGAKSITDNVYDVFAMITDIVKEGITDNTYDVCVGLRCQMFRAVEAEEEEPAGVIGGGGSLYEEQGNITFEEFNTSLRLCVEAGGVPVNIKGGIFCKIDDTYTPIEKFKEETYVFGIKIPDLGAQISNNAIVGWIAIFTVVIGSIVFIVRTRQKRSEEEVRRELIKKKEEEERNQKI